MEEALKQMMGLPQPATKGMAGAGHPRQTNQEMLLLRTANKSKLPSGRTAVPASLPSDAEERFRG